jgi:AcrR family transcriptional regulator
VSGNSAKSSRKKAARPKVDRRVLRTRDRLGDALVGLMHEKPFEEITVQHVLDRAGISRSTFYAHYTNKNDLFLGDVDDFWNMMATLLTRRNDQSARVAPVRELLTHMAEVTEFRAALLASGKIHDVMDLGREHFARAIEDRLTLSPQAGGLSPERRTVLAHMFAGALFSSANWWLDRGMKETPEQMDDLYHRMVWATVKAPAGE